MGGICYIVLVVFVIIWTFAKASPQALRDNEHQLLPDIIPTGPALDQSAPVFLEVPSPAYVTRSKPATLTCRAVHALTLFFKCNDEDVADKEHSRADFVDPQTAIRQLEVKLSVDMRAVDEYFGDYKCVCVAWSSRGGKESSSVKVTAAFLEKQFHTPPYDERVAEDRTAELRCVPPAGNPQPSVSWLRNGAAIDVTQEPNYIISNEGNLLVAAARMSDMANYSCVAENVAQRRVSPHARLTVYVNGGWSPWSEWSECAPPCGAGQRLRHRSCTSPRPLNGGAVCVGADAQAEPCRTHCLPMDGGWSVYGGWSECDVTCRQYRMRTCSEPPPARGGRGCPGPDRLSRNCSQTACRHTAGVERARAKQGSRAASDRDVALYVGLSAVLLVLPAIALMALKLYRRKGQGHMYGLTERDYEARYYDNAKKRLGYTPDLTAGVAALSPSPASCHSDSAYREASPNKTALISSLSEHHYDEPHLSLVKHMDTAHSSIGGDSETAESSIGSRGNHSSDKQLPGSSSHCSSPMSGANSPRREFAPVSRQQSPTSAILPSGVNPDNLKFATVSPAGVTLSLADAGVSLTVPEGAVAAGQTEEVYLAVMCDAKDRPQLAGQETLLSPVVLAGPPCTQFLKPAIISFQHCANLKTDWNISVYGSEGQPDDASHWESLVTLGEENINTPVFTQVDHHRAHIMTESLQRLALVGAPSGDGEAVKQLRLAAFGPRLVHGSSEYCIRVYVVEDTRTAYESVQQLERKLGGRLLDKPKTMLFGSGGAGLALSLEDLSLGWKCKPHGDCQEIPFSHVWSSTCPLLHCSFSLQHVGHVAARDGLAFSARVLACQQGTQTRRQMLRVSSSESSTGCISASARAAPSSVTISTTTGSPSGGSSVVTLDRDTNRLSPVTREGLCQCLNPPNGRGDDWRMLARMMQVNRYINYFATKQSPMECILDLWEARHPEPSAGAQLLNMLRLMGREDAVCILETELGPRV